MSNMRNAFLGAMSMIMTAEAAVSRESSSSDRVINENRGQTEKIMTLLLIVKWVVISAVVMGRPKLAQNTGKRVGTESKSLGEHKVSVPEKAPSGTYRKLLENRLGGLPLAIGGNGEKIVDVKGSSVKVKSVASLEPSEPIVKVTIVNPHVEKRESKAEKPLRGTGKNKAAMQKAKAAKEARIKKRDKQAQQQMDAHLRSYSVSRRM
jgi:hypothetical protein